jgi:hypothetical protein
VVACPKENEVAGDARQLEVWGFGTEAGIGGQQSLARADAEGTNN